MKRGYITIAAAAALAVALVGCAKKEKVKAPADLNAEVGALTEELNAYMSVHDPENTDVTQLNAGVAAFAPRYQAIAKSAGELQAKTGNADYGAAAALANEGAAKAEKLATALKGDVKTDPAIFAMLADATAAWAAYNDTVAAEGKPTTSPEPDQGKPTTSPLPGRGHHYGWWKNPAWANDPASRGALPATAATGDKQRDKDRGPKHEGKGGGPDRGDKGGHGPGDNPGHGRGQDGK